MVREEWISRPVFLKVRSRSSNIRVTWELVKTPDYGALPRNTELEILGAWVSSLCFNKPTSDSPITCYSISALGTNVLIIIKLIKPLHIVCVLRPHMEDILLCHIQCFHVHSFFLVDLEQPCEVSKGRITCPFYRWGDQDSGKDKTLAQAYLTLSGRAGSKSKSSIFISTYIPFQEVQDLFT